MLFKKNRLTGYKDTFKDILDWLIEERMFSNTLDTDAAKMRAAKMMPDRKNLV